MVNWIKPEGAGLTVDTGTAGSRFLIDALRASPRVVVTHGHADHARAGHDHVIATPETLAIMASRYGENFTNKQTPLRYGESLTLGDVTIRLEPAGHVLGSAQVVIDHNGKRVVVSGDYKRKADPTCAPFTPVACDVFVTEATFALPVFRHPDPKAEIDKLLTSLALFPHRCHVIGAYSLGKAQRLIALLREAGYTKPVYLHGAQQKLCQLYQDLGVDLGALEPATAGQKGQPRADLAGEIVIAPPSALNDKWSRRLPDPLIIMASGWMHIRQRAKQSGVELPLVLSVHGDWADLVKSFDDFAAQEVWVTHG
ncbi:MAG: ligase-associated DNA damage response exonuclease, partial [Alphaproteobacteria bacterium]|nr:ligase-associated DNA damage response exonuclease [Alphaproteobacteria bacterium]